MESNPATSNIYDNEEDRIDEVEPDLEHTKMSGEILEESRDNLEQSQDVQERFLRIESDNLQNSGSINFQRSVDASATGSPKGLFAPETVETYEDDRIDPTSPLMRSGKEIEIFMDEEDRNAAAIA